MTNKKKTASEDTAKKSTRKKTASVEKPKAVEEAKEETKNEAKETASKSSSMSQDDLTRAVATAVGVVKQMEKEEGKHGPSSTVPCRSVTLGKLIYIGGKTGQKYIWANHGDVAEVEAQDLESLRLTRSKYLFYPLIMIEDEEFLKQDKWQPVAKLYDKIMVDDIEELLTLDNTSFATQLAGLPDGFKKAVADTVSERILDNNFDSIQKIKIIDEVCGTDLFSLLS